MRCADDCPPPQGSDVAAGAGRAGPGLAATAVAGGAVAGALVGAVCRAGCARRPGAPSLLAKPPLWQPGAAPLPARCRWRRTAVFRRIPGWLVDVVLGHAAPSLDAAGRKGRLRFARLADPRLCLQPRLLDAVERAAGAGRHRP